MFLFCEVVYAFGKSVWSAILFEVHKSPEIKRYFLKY